MVVSMVRGEVKIKNVDVERVDDGKKTKPVVFLDPHSDGASKYDSSSDAELNDDESINLSFSLCLQNFCHRKKWKER